MDWTKSTSDPCNPQLQAEMSKFLQGIRVIERTDYMDWLLSKVNNKSCLDIGAVEHDLAYTEMPSWKHTRLVEVAERVTGVDILEHEVEVLKQRGFDMRHCDATSEEYLGAKYELVVLGDVIEHVSNPINLIRFALRHLDKQGEIIVKTPNPYYIDNIISFMKNKVFVNFEHIAWYTPTMALEIARRAGCQLSSYVVFPRKRPWSNIFPQSDLFTRDFVYIFSNSESVK